MDTMRGVTRGGVGNVARRWTLAYQAVKQAASSCLSKAAAKEDPGQDLADPLIVMVSATLANPHSTCDTVNVGAK